MATGTRSNAARRARANGAEAIAARPRFDVGVRKARAISEVVIYDPYDPAKKIDTGLRIGIRSVYSLEAKKAARDAAKAAEIRRQAIAEGDVDPLDDPEPLIASNVVEQTIGVTAYWYCADLSKPQRADGTWEREAGWEQAIPYNEEAFACTPKNVRKLYLDPETSWIQRQVQDWYLDDRNFFDAPKTESSPSPDMSSA